MTTTATPWVAPTPWPVPREWPDATCLIVCSGESAGAQKDAIRRFPGPVIAVKHGVLLRPDAQVLFMSGEWTATVAASLMPKWQGRGKPGHYAIVRGRSCPELDPIFLRVTRSKLHGTLSELRDHVTGYDTGTSAINLAYHFGATTIVLAGYDMRGGHFCKHPLQNPPEDHFRTHTKPLPELAQDAARKGIKIWNASPISRVTCFDYKPIEAFL